MRDLRKPKKLYLKSSKDTGDVNSNSLLLILYTVYEQVV